MTERSRVHDTLAAWLDKQCVEWNGSEEAHLHDDLGLDSLDSVAMMIFFEDQFGITIDDEDERVFEGHVCDLFDYMVSRIKPGALHS